MDIIDRFIQTHHLHISGTSDFIPNPVNPEENFADKWTEYPERKKAFDIWIHKIGTDFQVLKNLPFYETPDSHVRNLLRKSTNNTKYHRGTKNLPTVDFNIAHRQNLQFPIISSSEVAITASYRKKYGSFRSTALRSGQPIGKDNRITFKVNDKHIRGNKKYYWQVVNTGYEAIQMHNCPRGGFYDGEAKRGGKTRVETTSYEGSHWVQCFVVQNGKCVAKSPEFIVQITS